MEDHIQFDIAEHALLLLDQRLLPNRESHVACRNVGDIITALKTMVVRGAPAIGVTAAWGCVLALQDILNRQEETDWRAAFNAELDRIAQARPTAVNLRWAVERMRAVAQAFQGTATELLPRLEKEARTIHQEDIAICKALGRAGADCIPDNSTLRRLPAKKAAAPSGRLPPKKQQNAPLPIPEARTSQLLFRLPFRISRSCSSASESVCSPASISRDNWLTATTFSRQVPFTGIWRTFAKYPFPAPPPVRKMPLLKTKASSDSTPYAWQILRIVSEILEISAPFSRRSCPASMASSMTLSSLKPTFVSFRKNRPPGS